MNATTVPEACPTRKWRASVSNIGLTLEEDPLLNVGTLHNPLAAQTPQELEVELDPGCDRTRPWHPLIQAGLSVSVSLDSLVCVSIKFGGRNISIATLLSPRHLQLSLLETSTRFVVHLYRGFLKLFHSYRTQWVKAFSTDGKHGAGHFRRWNASRMRITSRCYSRPISASAQLEVPPIQWWRLAGSPHAAWLAELLW